MRLRLAGDGMLVAEYSTGIDPAASARARALEAALKARAPAGIVASMPGIRSLAIIHDPVRLTTRALSKLLEKLDAGLTTASEAPSSRWILPVCYEQPHGLDLDECAGKLKITVDELIARHLAGRYTALMVGSYPGHPYLGGLDPSLYLPRRVPPRVRVPRGSVAMAELMTNVYPVEAPGGWNVLGCTAAILFDLRWESPSLLSAGDEITFRRVGLEEHDTLYAAFEAGTLHPREACR
ncbi:5-oxoprolinase subunit B family protein [Rhodovarius crocodyli]|nr:carboxyltransferase domain-containing protein [Rhodovarius crocodyli]